MINGIALTDYLYYAAVLGFVLALIGLSAWLLRRLTRGKLSSGGRRGRRLAVSEAALVDKRRRLVLVRCDDREHLLMIGGPVDVVIETGITPPQDADEQATADKAQARKPPIEPPRMRRREPERTASSHTPLPEPRASAPRDGHLDRPRERPVRPPERPARPLAPAREPEEPAPRPFSDRPAPDSLKPDRLEPETPQPPQHRSMLNVRPGEEK